MPRFSSTKRPTALKDIDYDHEIHLIDHTTSISASRTRSASVSDNEHPRRDSLAPEETDQRRHSHESDQLHRKGTRTLREELARRKYGKYTTVIDHQPSAEPPPSAVPETTTSLALEVSSTHNNDGIIDTRPSTGESQHPPVAGKGKSDQDSVIDILYENERGGFLCGLPLFSSRALGAADAPPWTNVAQKASATNTSNAQVPDPSWEWAWKQWNINHTEDVDEDGWEYSCMYAKWCSWHGPSWYNSCVRRRAWTRKRVRKDENSRHRRRISEAHRLNSDYFTIHDTRSRSPSIVESRLSLGNRDMDQPIEREDIRDIGALLKALKESRIDRERTEAVENFIVNGGDDLVYLSEKMHDIMSQFIFQASRRSLLSHLTTLFEESSVRLQAQAEENDDNEDGTKLPNNLLEVPIEGKSSHDGDDTVLSKAAAQRRLQNIEAAFHAADKAVKTLEYWSDIKDMAEQGETKGAVDEEQGWDAERWGGVDNSGPKNVVSDPVVGRGEALDEIARGDTERKEQNGEADGDGDKRRVSFVEHSSTAENGTLKVDKGKGRETD